MNIEKIKKNFGDCDFMRTFFNEYTFDAIKWLINRVNELEDEQKKTKKALQEAIHTIEQYRLDTENSKEAY